MNEELLKPALDKLSAYVKDNFLARNGTQLGYEQLVADVIVAACTPVKGQAEIKADLRPDPNAYPVPAEPPTANEILGAVGRGWTHEVNAKKALDVDLAIAITAEVSDLLARRTAEQQNSPSELDIDPLTHPSYNTQELKC